jgi:hypothetical protein
MTPREQALMECTVSHFEEIARQNRFPDNFAIEHDASRCLVCHPEQVSEDAFTLYLEVVARSVLVRRPKLDPDLVEAVNEDLALSGEDYRVSFDSCAAGEEQSVHAWKDWIRSALATGLGLLSIHSPTSRDFDLEEEEAGAGGRLIEEKTAEILTTQRSNAGIHSAGQE